MNWDAIGAVGEVVGAVAVVVTLAYLAVQVRQNAVNVGYTARQALTQQNFEYTRMWMADAESTRLQFLLFSLPHDELDNPAQLSREELGRLAGLFYNGFENMASQHRAWQLGILSDDDWAETQALVDNYAQSPVTRDLWKVLGRNLFHESFVSFVDRAVERRSND